jgi:hypothetical protein
MKLTIIKSLAHVAKIAGNVAVLAVAYFAYLKLGVVWAIVLAVVLFPLVLLFVNICMFPAQVLFTTAALREAEEQLTNPPPHITSD